MADAKISPLGSPLHVPTGWPVVDDGLFMGYFKQALMVYVGRELTEASLGRQITELGRALDVRAGSGQRAVVVYDVTSDSPYLQARARQRVGEFLKAREKQLAELTAGYALATDSMVTRGVVRAVFWLAPPPYPHYVTSTVREGLNALVQHMPGLDPELVTRLYTYELERSGVDGLVKAKVAR